MIRHRLFDGVEKILTVYNQKALLDWSIEFYTEECDTDFDEDEVEYTFPSWSSGYFRVFNERLGTEIKDITTTKSGTYMIINASVSDMTFSENGLYYYEIGYIQTGGYEITLMYGKINVI